METAYFITAIVSLATAVVTLWYSNNKREKKYSEQMNENLVKMTEALTESSSVIENNTKAHERVFDYILKDSKKRK
jgi:hypothetical protein